MAAQFVGRLVDGVPGVPQGLAGVLQVVRVRGLDHVDHVVELVGLEVRLAEEADAATEEGVVQHLRHSVGRVDDADLLAHMLQIGLVVVALRLLVVAHQ